MKRNFKANGRHIRFNLRKIPVRIEYDYDTHDYNIFMSMAGKTQFSFPKISAPLLKRYKMVCAAYYKIQSILQGNDI